MNRPLACVLACLTALGGLVALDRAVARRHGAGLLVKAGRATTVLTVPAPTVPAPTVPAPTVPAPTVPAPTVPAPTVRSAP
ncbi:hypothetical protein [Pseudonocardia sp. WMMC193]|uniref:hypothetical protein n=1 Tax=Pseudonocardia sp. WMMC193 TaxID=2911965 RepID=UPI001F1B3DB1|nr:hypothetical protein [Pseudonocardia sp. WMMC193]MCF7548023.1 hypothetical protein [Pseudonocardia sp. WMMC193]